MLDKKEIKNIQCEIGKQGADTAVIFDALGDSTRFRIFRLLAEHGELCVTDISGVFGITMAAVSQQLKILELTDLVEKERMGQMICYRVNKKNPITRSIINFIK